MSQEIVKTDFQKSLERLATYVSKAQLHHTASNSATGGWAGSQEKELDDWEDGIEENGTLWSMPMRLKTPPTSLK